MKQPTITLDGEAHPFVVSNSTLMRFSALGGDLNALESNPVTQVIMLCCAALKLEGDPIDHADRFPPVAQLAEPIRLAMEIYSQGAPGEASGGDRPPSPESATD